ncbi:unnamed protein product, partial [Brachionus calyciflorus]
NYQNNQANHYQTYSSINQTPSFSSAQLQTQQPQKVFPSQQNLFYSQQQPVPDHRSYSQALQNNQITQENINPSINFTLDMPKQKIFTLKFKSKFRFDPRLKDYFFLEAVFRKMRPKSEINTIYINKNEELIIKTSNESQIQDLRTWTSDAFGTGIEEITKKQRFYLAMHNVDIEFDIESPRVKTELKNKYEIEDTLRMIKKSTGQKIQLVKAVMSNSEKFNQIMKNGCIYLGCSRIRVTQWKFGISPLQCFKCQKLGHRAESCTGKEKCLKCGKFDHKRDQCPVKDDPSKYHCINCGGNHVACSKLCPVLKQATEEKKLNFDKKIKTFTNNTTRIYSNFSNDQHSKQTVGLVKFIIELLKNISESSRAVNEDTSSILQSINTFLGPDICKAVSCSLSNYNHQRTQIEDLAIKNKADFISLNETFLNSKNKLEFNDYHFIRSDRKNKKGCGAALGVKKSIDGEKINLNQFKEVSGFMIKLKNEEPLAVFSIYISPKDKINEDLFNFITRKYKNLGDLNCKSES